MWRKSPLRKETQMICKWNHTLSTLLSENKTTNTECLLHGMNTNCLCVVAFFHLPSLRTYNYCLVSEASLCMCA